MQQINPPGIVREAESFEELVSQGQAINNAITQEEQMSLQKAVKLGVILNKLKDTCQHGQYGLAVERIGASQSRSDIYRKIAKLPARVISDCKSISEACRAIDEARNNGQDKENTGHVSGSPPAESQESEPDSLPWQGPDLPPVEEPVAPPTATNGQVKPRGKPRRARGTPKSKAELLKESESHVGSIVRAVDDAARGEKFNRYADEIRKLLQMILKNIKAWEKP